MFHTFFPPPPKKRTMYLQILTLYSDIGGIFILRIDINGPAKIGEHIFSKTQNTKKIVLKPYLKLTNIIK